MMKKRFITLVLLLPTLFFAKEDKKAEESELKTYYFISIDTLLEKNYVADLASMPIDKKIKRFEEEIKSQQQVNELTKQHLRKQVNSSFVLDSVFEMSVSENGIQFPKIGDRLLSQKDFCYLVNSKDEESKQCGIQLIKIPSSVDEERILKHVKKNKGLQFKILKFTQGVALIQLV